MARRDNVKLVPLPLSKQQFLREVIRDSASNNVLMRWMGTAFIVANYGRCTGPTPDDNRCSISRKAKGGPEGGERSRGRR